MRNYPIHTIADAPAQSVPVLQTLQQVFGFIPNIAGAMAGSPVLIKSFIGVFQNVHAGSFSEAQIQVLLLTNAVTNRCVWAVAFHTHLALANGVTAQDAETIRAGGVPKEAGHAALSALAKNLIETRGHPADDVVQAFIKAGFSHEQVLETVTVVAASTITNYTGSVVNPPLEKDFQAHAWAA